MITAEQTQHEGSEQDEAVFLPPPVDPHIRGACEPRVQKVNAPHRARPAHRLPQSRVIVETETFPEPVDGIWGHVSLKEKIEEHPQGQSSQSGNGSVLLDVFLPAEPSAPWTEMKVSAGLMASVNAFYLLPIGVGGLWNRTTCFDVGSLRDLDRICCESHIQSAEKVKIFYYSNTEKNQTNVDLRKPAPFKKAFLGVDWILLRFCRFYYL